MQSSFGQISTGTEQRDGLKEFEADFTQTAVADDSSSWNPSKFPKVWRMKRCECRNGKANHVGCGEQGRNIEGYIAR